MSDRRGRKEALQVIPSSTRGRETLMDYAAAPPADARERVASKAAGSFLLATTKLVFFICFFFSAAHRLLCTVFRCRTADLWELLLFCSGQGSAGMSGISPEDAGSVRSNPLSVFPPAPLHCLPLCFSQSEWRLCTVRRTSQRLIAKKKKKKKPQCDACVHTERPFCNTSSPDIYAGVFYGVVTIQY